MLHGFNVTDTRKFGETKIVTVPIWCENPGIITVSAPGCTFPDGNTVTIAGTRTWRNRSTKKSNAFFAPEAASAVMKNRNEITIGIELNLENLFNDRVMFNTTMSGMRYICSNYLPPAAGRQYSWEFIATFYQGGLLLDMYANAANDGITITQGYLRRVIAVPDSSKYYRFCIIFPATGTFPIREKLDGYGISSTSSGFSPGAFSGVIPGVCQTFFKDCARFFYSDSILSTSQQDLFLNGGMPTDPCVVQYAFDEEDAASVYDLSGNNYDGVLNLDAGRETIGIDRDFTDDPLDPVVPNNSIRIAVPYSVESPINVAYSRPRQGVPSRAPSNERYETATSIITLNDELVNMCNGPDQHIRTRLP
jgi:hypothetical protein